jgi:NAD+ kinase
MMSGGPEMDLVGVLFNPEVAEAEPLAQEVIKWIDKQGRKSWLTSTNQLGERQKPVNGTSLIVVLGGDGTTLMAARLAVPHEIPIFGINLGRVGFLSEASPKDWHEKLIRVMHGDYWLERRLMLRAEVIRQGDSLADLMALNDVVVSRGAQVRVVRFHLFVDGDHVTTYTADGLIAATPTGSTAYSMAAGGPLLPPQLQNFLVLPVAPHLSFERPLVLHQKANVKIRVETEHEAMATADGQDAISLQSGDEVIINKHAYDSIFARVDGPSYFYLRLMQRLSYWSRKQ